MNSTRAESSSDQLEQRLHEEAQRELASHEPQLVEQVVARARTSGSATLPANMEPFPIPVGVRWALAACIGLAALTVVVLWPQTPAGGLQGPMTPMTPDRLAEADTGTLWQKLAPHQFRTLLDLPNQPVREQFEGLERASIKLAKTVIGDLPGKLVEIHAQVEPAVPSAPAGENQS